MTWLPPDDAPCIGADPEIFHPNTRIPEGILPALLGYCQHCSDQAGRLARGIELRAWGAWGGVGLRDGAPTRQPSGWSKRTYQRRKRRSEQRDGASGKVPADSA